MPHPLDSALQQLVQHHQILTIPPLPAEVLSQAGQTLELRLKVPDNLLQVYGLDAGLQGVPLALQGCWEVTLLQGAQVVVTFLASDPRQPVVLHIVSGTILSATVDAASISIGSSATDIRLGKGSNFVAALGDPVTATVIGTPANVVVKV